MMNFVISTKLFVEKGHPKFESIPESFDKTHHIMRLCTAPRFFVTQEGRSAAKRGAGGGANAAAPDLAAAGVGGGCTQG